MRWGIGLLVLAVSVYLFVPAALMAGEAAWVVMSTEEDETFDGSGYAGRHALQLYPPYVWQGLNDGIFFDPGPGVIGIPTGLDAFHYDADEDLIYFSTEVDFKLGSVDYTDQDLLVWDGMTLGTVAAFDTLYATLLPDDYGLDAVCYVGDVWVFSTSQHGLIDNIGPFSDGDLLVLQSDGSLEVFPLEQLFERNVGLDALHAFHEQGPDGGEKVEICMSTEVDGEIYSPITGGMVSFNDEDVLVLNMHKGAGSDDWILDEVRVPWTGIFGFDRDVGLDALYLYVPEPTTVLLVGLGIGALVLRLRRKR